MQRPRPNPTETVCGAKIACILVAGQEARKVAATGARTPRGRFAPQGTRALATGQTIPCCLSLILITSKGLSSRPMLRRAW